MNWALSLKRVFGGAMRVIVSIEDPDVIAKILTHLDAKGAEPWVSGRQPCRAPPQRELFY